MFYKFIWFLLQICVSIIQLLRFTFQRLKTASRSYDRSHSSAENEKVYLNQCRPQLSKLPRHLSLIIGPDEQIEHELISRIIKYAFQMNIECVSFYDTRSNEKHRIRLHKLQQPKDMTSKELGERHLVWTECITAPRLSDISNVKPSECNGNSCTNGQIKQNGHINGFKAARSIEIYEIDASDGRELISEVCRKLFIQRQNNEIKDLLQNRTLLSQRIDKDLSLKLWNCKDPELCIVFSKQMCTYGMLPWHTRFTEFYLHHHSDVFDVKTFAEILFKYSRCEQRWGK